MELRDPFDAYVSLWEGISGEKRTAGAAAELLERHFVKEPSQYAEQGNLRQKKRPATVVVLLDEIDYLTTNKQTVLYNFFNWPLKSEGLVILGISNTINLPERLHPRVQSRLGAERCIFQSYKVQEVVDILSFRLSRGKNGPCDVAFDRDAITFAARKTAVFTGDIRKAFQLCRVAAECVITDIQSGRRIAAEEGRGGAIVRIPDVQKAAKDLLDSPLLKAVATCTSFEALVLVSLAALRWSSGREDGRCRVKDLLIKMRGVANSLGNVQYFPVPTFDELIEMLNRMGEVSFFDYFY
jgi:origin recognition complex subunit 1